MVLEDYEMLKLKGDHFPVACKLNVNRSHKGPASRRRVPGYARQQGFPNCSWRTGLNSTGHLLPGAVESSR